MVKNLPTVQQIQETRVRSLGQEDPLEKGMETLFSILAWKVPWTVSLAGYSPRGYKELNMTEATAHAHTLIYILTTIF